MMPGPDAYTYWYSANIAASLTNGSTTTISIRFEEATVFELHAMFAWTDLDIISTIQGAQFLCKLSDTGSGQQLSNGYIPRQAMFGSLDHRAGVLPAPTQFGGKSTLTFDLQNICGTTMASLYISLLGIRWKGRVG